MIRARYTAKGKPSVVIEIKDEKCNHGFDVLIAFQKRYAPQWNDRVDLVASRLIAEQKKVAT